MPSIAPDPLALARRVETLERANRRLSRFALAAVSMAGLAALVAATRGPAAPETVEASRFLLRDGSGSVAARLELVPEVGGARLVLVGREGASSAVLTATPNDSQLALNANGVPRLDLQASTHADIARLTFRSDDGDVRLQAATESALSSIYLHSLPNEKGIKSNIGLYMPPEPDNLPRLSMRLADLREKLWTLP